MKHLEKRNKIHQLMADNQLDALLLCNTYNIQYATGVDIASAHAQTDLPMFAIFIAKQTPILLVPHCWEGSAIASCTATDIKAYASDKQPLEAAIEMVVALCQTAKQVGTDADMVAVATGIQLSDAFAQVGIAPVSCGQLVKQARAIKTDEEVVLLKKIAYKTDHVINGHFHHLIATRPKSAASISESLRVHSSERDIPIAGYNACARAVLGQSLSKFWAYAPKFGFAEAEMTQQRDAIIADVLTCEDGYWNNATRIAISHDDVSAEQESAYAQLNRLRELLIAALQIGRPCADVYREVVESAQREGLTLVSTLCLGFSVGVSPHEGPFLAPGEGQTIEENMVLVLDPVVAHGGLYYRSRDTVVMTSDGAEIVNWYKDWREPYIAILEL